MAPPSTPAQPRFLLSKRQAQPTQQQKQDATPDRAGPQQFASTPRFNVPSATAKSTVGTSRQPSTLPPPLLFSTPGPATARPSRAPRLEPMSDVIDSSPISSTVSRDDDEGGRHALNESIEIDESPSASRALAAEEDGRSAKRRRVTISPEVEGSAEVDLADEPMSMDEDAIGPIIDSSPHDEDDTIIAQSQPQSEDDPMTEAEDREGAPEMPFEPTGQPARQQHPTFRPAPRFKAPEQKHSAVDAQRRAEPLPEAFSPRRHGAKYVPGGLAAELRDWLLQLKGTGEGDGPAARATLEEVTRGEGMWIVAARGEQGIVGEGDDASETVPARVLLAGDGRGAAGLGDRRRTTVRAGEKVALYQPIWDIELGNLGRFSVTCDWETEE